MRPLFQTAIGRLTVLSVVVAMVVGAIWSWRTSPWYLVQDEYFITVSPDESYLARGGANFDISSQYHRSLLVSGPLPVPFGVDPATNGRLLDRGLDLDSSIWASVTRLYATYCGFPDDEHPKARAWWKDTRLCNSAELNGKILEAAVAKFHNKVDEEIVRYRLDLAKNAAEKMGKSLLAALGLVVLTAAGMWVTRGRLS
jgi:hypothetical protein